MKKQKKFYDKKEMKLKVILPPGWFYFNSEEFTVSDIQEKIKDTYDTEIWKEAGVLEVILSEEGSMDLEKMEKDAQDEDTRAFLAEKQVQSLFYATFKNDMYEKAKSAMELITKTCGGYFCGDTADFLPEIR